MKPRQLSHRAGVPPPDTVLCVCVCGAGRHGGGGCPAPLNLRNVRGPTVHVLPLPKLHCITKSLTEKRPPGDPQHSPPGGPHTGGRPLLPWAPGHHPHNTQHRPLMAKACTSLAGLRGAGKQLTFSREIFFLPQPSQVMGNLGQTSWCAWGEAVRSVRGRTRGVPALGPGRHHCPRQHGPAVPRRPT